MGEGGSPEGEGHGQGISARGSGGSRQQDEMTSVQGVPLTRMSDQLQGRSLQQLKLQLGRGEGRGGDRSLGLSREGTAEQEVPEGPGPQGFPPEAQQQGWCGAWLQACPGQLSPAVIPRAPPSRPLSSLAPARVAGGRRVVPDGDDGHLRVRGGAACDAGRQGPPAGALRAPPPKAASSPTWTGPVGPRRVLGPHTVRGALPWGPSLLSVTCRKGPCGCPQGERVARP